MRSLTTTDQNINVKTSLVFDVDILASPEACLLPYSTLKIAVIPEQKTLTKKVRVLLKVV